MARNNTQYSPRSFSLCKTMVKVVDRKKQKRADMRAIAAGALEGSVDPPATQRRQSQGNLDFYSDVVQRDREKLLHDPGIVAPLTAAKRDRLVPAPPASCC